jgi:hypothetical protein
MDHKTPALIFYGGCIGGGIGFVLSFFYFQPGLQVSPTLIIWFMFKLASTMAGVAGIAIGALLGHWLNSLLYGS